MPGSFQHEAAAVPDFTIAEKPNSGYDFRWRVIVDGQRVEVIMPNRVLRTLAQRAVRNADGKATMVGITAKRERQ